MPGICGGTEVGLVNRTVAGQGLAVTYLPNNVSGCS